MRFYRVWYRTLDNLEAKGEIVDVHQLTSFPYTKRREARICMFPQSGGSLSETSTVTPLEINVKNIEREYVFRKVDGRKIWYYEWVPGMAR